MVFARETSDSLASLVKKLDAEVGSNKAQRAAFVILLTQDGEAGEKKLKEIVEKEGIKNVSMSVMENVGGPDNFKTKVAKDAEVTVILYKAKKTVANHAFEKGKFDSKGVEAVVADLPKINN